MAKETHPAAVTANRAHEMPRRHATTTDAAPILFDREALRAALPKRLLTLWVPR